MEGLASVDMDFQSGGFELAYEVDRACDWIRDLRGNGADWSPLWPDGNPIVYHWSHAVASTLDNAYNAARTRHPERHWPALNWYDLLTQVVRAEPFVVRGALGFGLKASAFGSSVLMDAKNGSIGKPVAQSSSIATSSVAVAAFCDRFATPGLAIETACSVWTSYSLWNERATATQPPCPGR